MRKLGKIENIITKQIERTIEINFDTKGRKQVTKDSVK